MNNKYAQKVSFLRLMGVVLYDSLLVFSFVFTIIGIATIFDVDRKFIFWLITLPVSYIYFVYSWVTGGQTLGMKSWGVSIEGATYKTATIRFFASIFSWSIAGIGFIFVLFNRNKVSLHDKISQTFLIYTPKK